MIPAPDFKIDLEEKFPLLERAPSIEAIIHWQAHPSKKMEQTVLEDELIGRLPEYPICQAQREVQFSASGTPDSSSEIYHRTDWNGFRLQDNHNHVAQFTPKGVVFSRLEPYQQWETFKDEAMKFWDIFKELAAPTAIQRLGVRYINQIGLGSGEQPSSYLKNAPSSFVELQLSPRSFFHQDTYQVPGHPYFINWVRTIQPQQSPLNEGQSLIIDIDVYTTELSSLDQDSLIQRLSEMRWLKNKVFFNCMTEVALESFGRIL